MRFVRFDHGKTGVVIDRGGLNVLDLVEAASAIFLGPSFAAMQQVAPAAHRAQATALLLLGLNLVGLGLGPQLVGIISHLLQQSMGADALRYALAIVTTAPVVPAAGCFWFAAKALRGSESARSPAT